MEKQIEKLARRRWAPFKRFRKEEDGAVAIEFALVSIPTVYIIGAIVELAVGFFANGMLDSGVQDVARMVRTKQVTLNTHSEAQFKQLLCGQPILSMFDCGKMVVDLQQIAQFNNPATPRNPNGTVDSSNMGFNPGRASSINVLRVYYDFPVMMDWMKSLGPTATPTGRLMQTTQAFMIEP